jgi:hypothetical protein
MKITPWKYLLLVVASSSFAPAQDCSSGTCRKPVRNTVTAVATPVFEATETAVHAVEHVVQSTVQSATCATQKAVAVATRPVKRVFTTRRARCCR